MGQTSDVVIVDGVRTPVGNFGGALKDLPAQKLGEDVVRALVERTGIDPSVVEEITMGCAGQYSDAPNVARVVALRAGLPKTVTGMTVQRNCASGLQAIATAYQNILTGQSDVQIAGGCESMSGAPYMVREMRWGKKLRHAEFVDVLWEGLTDPVCGQLMGETAENLVDEFGLTREDLDKFAVHSHKRAFRATREGKFKDEIVTVHVPKRVAGREVTPEPVSQDEGPNIALTMQSLALYPTIFREGGTVTPGNSCPMNDGAAALLVMSAARADALGLKPMARIRSHAYAALEPERMGLGPTLAVPRALERAELTLADVDLLEINEAFAAQYLACQRVLGFDDDRTNVNGGAIALGHPIGASGARITVTLLHEMKRRAAKIGVATLCVGGGQGAAMVFERVD